MVDITNYVMFSLNQPLHCYDCTKIDGDVIIRSAKNGEKFTDLFDNEYTLNGEETLICDKNKILCLGGVIGGKDSCTDMESNSILLDQLFLTQ